MTSAPAWMPTAHNRKFFFGEKLLENELWIDDIAHSLSRQGRYNGHTRVHYSVAEHCVRVSWLCKELAVGHVPVGELDLWGLAGLMHDAAEAYTGDIISPIKSRFFDASIEHDIDTLICEQFGIPMDVLHSDRVKHCDRVLLSTELRDLFAEDSRDPNVLFLPPLPERLEPWPAEIAEKMFISRYLQMNGPPQMVGQYIPRQGS